MKKIIFFLVGLATTFILHAQEINLEDSLQQYTGKYKFPEGSSISEVTVTLSNGILTGSSVDGSSELKRMQGDTFQIVSYNGTAIFKRSSDRKVNGLRIIVEDLDVEGTKTEISVSSIGLIDRTFMVFDLPKLKRRQLFDRNGLLFSCI